MKRVDGLCLSPATMSSTWFLPRPRRRGTLECAAKARPTGGRPQQRLSSSDLAGVRLSIVSPSSGATSARLRLRGTRCTEQTLQSKRCRSRGCSVAVNMGFKSGFNELSSWRQLTQRARQRSCTSPTLTKPARASCTPATPQTIRPPRQRVRRDLREAPSGNIDIGQEIMQGLEFFWGCRSALLLWPGCWP